MSQRESLTLESLAKLILQQEEVIQSLVRLVRGESRKLDILKLDSYLKWGHDR